MGAEELLKELQTWGEQWRDKLELTCRDPSSASTIRHQALTILLTFYMLLAIACRLRIAVNLVGSQSTEEEAVSSCIGVLSLRRFTMRCESPSHFWGSIYCRTTAGTHATSASWKKAIESASDGDTIDAGLFDQWCSMIGREAHGAGEDLLVTHAEGG